MPFEDSLRLSLDTLIDSDGDQDQIYNPFADDGSTPLTSPPSAPSSPSTSSSASSGSAHGHGAGPWAARRGSGGGARKGAGVWAHGHMRAQSECSGRREPPGLSTGANGHHPLRSAGLHVASGHEYSSITRPTLSRMLGSLDAGPAPPDGPESASLDVGAPGVEERVVLVHEISPKDSLAGVALKYGISMAELRRTNHLWASDPIHFRKVLYIPLEDTSLSPPPSHSDSSTQEHSYSHSRSQSHSNSHHAPPSSPPEEHHTAHGTLHNMSTIRRIPASQLSFFPPASKPSALPPPLPSDALASRHTRHPPTPPRTFSSIFTALPIVSRLSFDSASSTSDEQEHELDEVRTAKAAGLFLFAAMPKQPENPSPPTHSPLRDRTTPRRPHARTPSHGNYPPDDIPASHRVSWAEDEHARAYAAVRTVQLEPSQGMQLPRLTRSASVGAGSVDSRLTLRA